MVDITLVRQEEIQITEEDKATVRRVLFGIINGLGDVNKKRWANFWNRVLKLQPGEMVDVRTHQARLGWYHRKHMNFEQKLFESQERFDNFDQFRMWLKVGAGHVDWLPGPKGGVIPVPKSISYANMEQAQMEVFHAQVLEFVQQEHATRTLWKHLQPQQQREYIDTVIAMCGAFEM